MKDTKLNNPIKIHNGKYEYCGFIITCFGYYPPERRVCWEAVDIETNCSDFRGYSMREIKLSIDNYFLSEGKKK